jgi:ATP-dependent DNA helicase RecQ
MAAARQTLAKHWGYSGLRPAQKRVITSILAGRDTLAILPTGGGKSLCFQVPALVREGLTIVVSPLLALMQDQVDALRARGIAAAAMNSLLKAPEQAEVVAAAARGELKLLYVSPERLDRLAGELARAKVTPTLLAIDEAHCLAEWGHDFRPAYRSLGRLRWKLGRPQVVALTGSATPEVRQDIAATLRLGAWGPARGRWDLHLGSFDRPNLWFGVVRVRTERDRWERMHELLKGEDRTALVYVPTRGLAEGVARGLSARGIRAAAFHAGLPTKEKKETLRRFLDDEVEVVVATCAFGMGIDKPTVRLVVHWSLPPTPESYYQEAGRAGRDGRSARCVLLHHPADAELHRSQLDVTFPSRELCERVWENDPRAARTPGNVRDSIERLRRELRPERGGVDWRPVAIRRARAESRLEAMASYASGSRCRRGMLLSYFGESIAECAGCERCIGRRIDQPLDGPARERLRDLRRALAPIRTPWGGAILEPEVLARLAGDPPDSAEALAAVPGVGPALTASYGGRILTALGVAPEPGSVPQSDPRLDRLLAWRGSRALAEGVEPWQVLPEGALRAIAAAKPGTTRELASLGLGPRALAAYGPELLDLMGEKGGEETGIPAHPVVS